MTSPFLARQLAHLDAALPGAGNPVYVLVYDTQGAGPLIEHLCGTSAEIEQADNGIAWFRLSHYLPTGELLVERIQEVADSVDWVFLHTGCSVMPPAVLELLRFVAVQEATRPRFVVVGEQTDVIHGDAAMKQLFFESAPLLDLRAQT